MIIFIYTKKDWVQIWLIKLQDKKKRLFIKKISEIKKNHNFIINKEIKELEYYKNNECYKNKIKRIAKIIKEEIK